MKITNVEAFPVSEDGRSHLFVVVDTDEGIYGVGESGLTGRAQAVIGALEHFKPQLIGQDPFRIGHLWQVMYRGGFFPAKLILSSAASAVDIALWTSKVRRSTRPSMISWVACNATRSSATLTTRAAMTPTWHHW